MDSEHGFGGKLKGIRGDILEIWQSEFCGLFWCAELNQGIRQPFSNRETHRLLVSFFELSVQCHMLVGRQGFALGMAGD
jgi:hypothetical protein